MGLLRRLCLPEAMALQTVAVLGLLCLEILASQVLGEPCKASLPQGVLVSLALAVPSVGLPCLGPMASRAPVVLWSLC